MTIRYSKDSLKFLNKLDKKSVDRIRAAINGLTKTPPEGDIKPLQGSRDSRMRLRVGSWDPDYTRLTDSEAKSLAAAEKSGFVDENDIDWSKVGC